eukprot:scaffold212718_cov31-Tisochrysis_lutea.AAC.4
MERAPLPAAKDDRPMADAAPAKGKGHHDIPGAHEPRAPVPPDQRATECMCKTLRTRDGCKHQTHLMQQTRRQTLYVMAMAAREGQ